MRRVCTKFMGRQVKPAFQKPLWIKEGMKRLIRGPNWKDGRGEEVLERNLLVKNEASQAIITARLLCEECMRITQMCAF